MPLDLRDRNTCVSTTGIWAELLHVEKHENFRYIYYIVNLLDYFVTMFRLVGLATIQDSAMLFCRQNISKSCCPERRRI